jgi:para-nitrobenzyl esterase
MLEFRPVFLNRLPMSRHFRAILFVALVTLTAQLSARALEPFVKTANGLLEGTYHSSDGVTLFAGVPFAAPPVGPLRWREPQPVADWSGVREAKKFGPRAMQLPIFSDMQFRSDGTSEDCLYLNVWTPAKTDHDKLPVLVYFYGGGLVGGDGSEYRYDGESMAQKGIVSLTVNYRLGCFGFLAHPELTAESTHHASGNYGLLDQSAALQWVQKNIAAFGGDPKRVTIAGESAGSTSVCAQMASPLSKNLIAGAIGESGSVLGDRPATPLARAEQNGLKFADAVGAKSLADLRAMPAQALLDASGKRNGPRIGWAVDGWFFPKDPAAIFAAGEQARVPLLVGWNSEESGKGGVLGRDEATPENLTKAIHRLYTNDAEADAILKAYSASTPDEAAQAATDLASDRFIAFNTWRWSDLQRKTGGQPVYRYYFSRPRPAPVVKSNFPSPKGAVHASEIEYAMGNLPSNKVYTWTLDDYAVSDTMEDYFANFIKHGNPNGPGLPRWPANTASGPVQVMHIDVWSQALPETHADRYSTLDQLAHSRH